MPRLSPEEVISYPVMSEDTVKLIETENKITFIIDGRANKNDVRRAVEELYEVQVFRDVGGAHQYLGRPPIAESRLLVIDKPTEEDRGLSRTSYTKPQEEHPWHYSN